jgi:glycosyltransferase involved in cell wall biosynthesis
MRIAVVSTPFLSTPPRDYGGTELVVSELVEGLVARGHAVKLFATGDSHTTAELRALYARPQWPPDPLADINHVAWALHRVAESHVDLVHVNSAAALSVIGLCPRVPLVYTLHHPHDAGLSAFYTQFPNVHYVAISEDQRSRETGLAHCRVIHHGVDPSHYELSEHPGDYVCFIGRLAPEKGPHTAIDAAALAGVPIRVAGQVHPQDRGFAERELTARLGAEHVRFLGPVGMAQKVPLLRDARALLAPITWDEPFGLIFIEAMLCGCPVVAFPRGSVPELVEEGTTGVIVESLEEMAAAIAPGGAVDRINRRRCRAHARQRFSRARLVADHERLYADVLASRDLSVRSPIAAA